MGFIKAILKFSEVDVALQELEADGDLSFKQYKKIRNKIEALAEPDERFEAHAKLKVWFEDQLQKQVYPYITPDQPFQFGDLVEGDGERAIFQNYTTDSEWCIVLRLDSGGDLNQGVWLAKNLKLIQRNYARFVLNQLRDELKGDR